MNLFQLGAFTLHSGKKSNFKIDCDALSDQELYTLAHQLLPLLPYFTHVFGIPRGGTRLAKLLNPYCTATYNECTHTEVPPHLLIVDDVYTTGTSMEEAARKFSVACWGAVLFARQEPPAWVTPLFTMTSTTHKERFYFEESVPYQNK